MKYDAIVVGGGMAGLTAAAYLAKAGRKVALFERQMKTGGLVQTFQRNGVYFDGGLRSIENSGIVFPMLKQLGIDIEFEKSPISVGIADSVLILKDKESVFDYENFLKKFYPENEKDVEAIILEIRKIMGYMDVIYGIDNPIFLDIKKDYEYFIKTVFPWMFKFIFTIDKIAKLDEPVEDYLKRLSKNQALIDIIAQHFFQQTPTSFALSYFSLYLDYHYPKGGTATLIQKMEEFIVAHGGEVKTGVMVETLHPEQKFIVDADGKRSDYSTLIWAGDQKLLYNCIPTESLSDKKLVQSIENKKAYLRDLKGGDSVYTAYLTVDLDKSHFEQICTGHFFYTPDKAGLSTVSKEVAEKFINLQTDESQNPALKQEVKDYIRDYFRMNTFEIAIPALRDSSLAPAGKSGLVVSLLFDYRLAKKIEDFGWSDEMRAYMEEISIEVLDASIFPGLKANVSARFSSTPVTIYKLTGNTDGGITGWAHTNPYMPVIHKMSKVVKSVDTILPAVFQAGQWAYSPSGLPISILTGKLAADKALKKII